MDVAAFGQPKKQSVIVASIGLPVMSKCAKYARDYSVRAVAQLGRAPGSGPGGRGFKSHQPDQSKAEGRRIRDETFYSYSFGGFCWRRKQILLRAMFVIRRK